MSILFWKRGASKEAFRARFIETARQKYPELNYELDEDFGVKVTGAPGGRSIDIWLERAYKEFEKSPEEGGAIIARWMGTLDDLHVREDTTVAVERIVPMIKPRTWEEDQRALLVKQHGPDVKTVTHWIDEYNAELAIVYAERRSSIHYPGVDEFQATGETWEELRAIAIVNLKRQTTGRVVTGERGRYLVSGDSTLDASLLLNDEVLKDARLQINGTPIVGVPDRDTFAICGANDPEQILELAALTARLNRSESYPVSDKLFILVDGKFEMLDANPVDTEHPIPNLDVIDVFGVGKSGGARFVVVIASPLQADARSIYRLFRKLNGHVNHIASQEFEQKCGKPTPENTIIEVSIHPDSAAIVFDVLESLTDWVVERNATLIVQRRNGGQF
jgi:uncharacterized protein YtpQ (UPF0354 family)